jgi:hypothetical protein
MSGRADSSLKAFDTAMEAAGLEPLDLEADPVAGESTPEGSRTRAGQPHPAAKAKAMKKAVRAAKKK